MPLIGIVIPSYNCGAYISSAIDSVLTQSVSDSEVIVVDDGSTDNTLQVLQPYFGHPRFRYISQENRGVSATRNAGAKLLQAKYLAFVDADDALAPGALELVLTEFDRSKSCWCLIDVWKTYGGKRELQRTRVPSDNHLRGILQEDFIRRGIFFKRADFFDIGMYDETLHIREDWDINIRMFEKRKPFSYIPKPLYLYNHRPGSLTKSGQMKVLFSTEKVLRKHHKRLADAGDKYISEIYARNMWGLAREYLYNLRDVRGTVRCISESLRYDLSISRLVHPFVQPRSRRGGRAC